jgi:outer membrane protein OmpA-like peptidoglycan-associated protein
VRPFITAGIGSEKTELDYPAAIAAEHFEERDWGWNAGLGLRFFLSPGLNLRLDGRYVSMQVGDEDIGEFDVANMEATAGLSLLFGGGDAEVAEAVPVTPNQAPTVTCTADRSQVLPGEPVTLTATATDPEGDPVTYMWTSSAGTVSGTGTTATLDFTGVTAPSTATVTVRATDSNGNSGTSDCSVQLAQAQRPAEAVSCIAGGFPNNRARLNNVDKACLDDVASRLSSDPRARVVVVGSADASETAGTGQQRADAVRDYLVTERRIEAARITTESGAGMEGRQVTVWFVPEGATIPGR